MTRLHHVIGPRIAGAGLALALGLGTASAANLNVPGQYATIQDAVDAASDGDVIVVADGTYAGADIVNKSLTVQSASDDPAACIIDSGFTGFYVAGAVTEVSVTLRGLGIDGVQRGVELTLDVHGTIENCVIRNCSLAGLFMNALSLDMTDTIVHGNTTSNSGGGMQVNTGDVTLLRTRWRNNTVETGGYAYGGALSIGSSANVRIVDSFFRRNRVNAGGDSQGGAIYASGGSPLVIANTVFEENEAEQNGGAVHLLNRGAFLDNVQLVDNRGGFGGGLFIENEGGITDDPVFVNNTLIVGNVAETGSGGGIRNRRDSRLFVTSSTIYDNTSTLNGGGIANAIGSELTVTSCILGDNSFLDIDGDGTHTVTYSNVQSGFAGEGNINVTPQFVDQANGDYRLADGSPCIDAGDAATYRGFAHDLDGNPRVVDDPDVENTGFAFSLGAIDMGPYERQTVDPCPYDLDGNGAMDFADILLILAGWGECP